MDPATGLAPTFGGGTTPPLELEELLLDEELLDEVPPLEEEPELLEDGDADPELLLDAPDELEAVDEAEVLLAPAELAEEEEALLDAPDELAAVEEAEALPVELAEAVELALLPVENTHPVTQPVVELAEDPVVPLPELLLEWLAPELDPEWPPAEPLWPPLEPADALTVRSVTAEPLAEALLEEVPEALAGPVVVAPWVLELLLPLDPASGDLPHAARPNTAATARCHRKLTPMVALPRRSVFAEAGRPDVPTGVCLSARLTRRGSHGAAS